LIRPAIRRSGITGSKEFDEWWQKKSVANFQPVARLDLAFVTEEKTHPRGVGALRPEDNLYYIGSMNRKRS